MIRLFLISFFILLNTLVTAQEQETFSIYFPFDVSEIPEDEKNKIFAELLPFIDTVKVLSIQMIGNTDSYSSNDYNQVLGMKRAVAAKEVLEDFLPVASTISSLGKSTPKFSNETNEGRSSNRRVDIIVKYQLIQKEYSEANPAIDTETMFENDTLIKFPEGIELHVKANTFYPNKIKEVTFKAQEVLSPYSIYQRGLSTMTADGRCLKSGGMMFTDAQINGQSVQPNDSILVRIPASEIDTNMKIWDIQVVDGDTLWVESDIKLNFNEDGGYYEFKSKGLPSINVDVPVVSGVVSGIGSFIDLLTKPFDDDDLTIKSRRKVFIECYLVSNDELIVLKGDLFKPKKSYFEPCLTDPQDIVICHTSRKGKDYYMVTQLGDLKFKKLLNHYVIRKKNLKQITSKEEYDKQIEEHFSHLQ